jgi:16S rRNA (cytosine1402-N4)-methyltransferase
LDEVLALLVPRPNAMVVDCTVGWAGHSVELLRRIGPDGGTLIGLDLDGAHLPQARERLTAVGHPFTLVHSNFAALPAVLAEHGAEKADFVLADLGMSSMQVDDADRGFSYVRDGPLDMRMDRSRGRSAAQLLATIGAKELSEALRDFGDEPEAARIAAAIVAARQTHPLERTGELVRVVREASGNAKEPWRLHPGRGRWNLHPAARTFQALRILVNRELASLQQLLRVLPECLNSGGRAAIISFHSGEDRLVKAAFRDGLRTSVYGTVSPEPIRATEAERTANPRSRSAKLRWAERT